MGVDFEPEDYMGALIKMQRGMSDMMNAIASILDRCDNDSYNTTTDVLDDPNIIDVEAKEVE